MDLQVLFSSVLNMTITGSIVIICVLLARLALGKAPRGFACALWAVVLFRLLCPVSVSAPVSVLSAVDVPAQSGELGAVEYIPSPVSAPVETMVLDPELVVPSEQSEPAEPAETPIDWHLIASRLWAAGAAALAVYGILSYVNLKRKLREAVPAGEGVREADGIGSPFVLGLVRPIIYLPSTLGEAERGYILRHERCHLRHGDHVVKAMFFLALCIHWFNPLVWLAFRLCGRDMEMRCDEAVLKQLGPQVRSDYAQSLLNFAAGRRVSLTALAFGEGDTGKRVKHVLNWKKKALWAAIPAAVLCAVVLCITAVNPGGSFDDTPFGHSYRAGQMEVPTGTHVSFDRLYTLSSDMVLFIREDGGTEMAGTFRTAEAREVPGIDNVRRAWKTDGGDWRLAEQEDGTLWLIEEAGAVVGLVRADLLGVTVKQPGRETTIEPTWYWSGSPDWYSSTLSTTLVDGDAELVFQPEADVEKILVSEEYHSGGGVTVSEHVLERNPDGTFTLAVSRQSQEGDDGAVYRVTVGEDNYLFRLTFPAVPGVTAVSGPTQEQTREVTFSDGGAYITLQLPEGWEYVLTDFSDEAYSAGITFWPRGREEGRLRFNFYPQGFGVCGTGLECTDMILAGRNVSVGTYDGGAVWDYISFGEDFAVWGEGHESWWSEYGGEAMEILDTAQFGQYVDMEAVRSYFRDFRRADLGEGTVLRGEQDYQAVYYAKDETLRLYKYTAAGTEVQVLNEWFGPVYEDVCISVSCLTWEEGEYVYFGYLRDSQDGVSLKGGSFRFLLEDGWTIDLILDDFRGFCFVCNEPMADFELRTADGKLVLDLDGYLERGCLVGDALPVLDGEIACELT